MKKHINYLDGIRGLLALSVFWGHTTNAVGVTLPGLRNLLLAVDMFMFLSGFIMAWQWEMTSQGRPDIGYPERTKSFYIRRWCRIAPLYYLLLFVSIAVHPQWNEARSHLREAFHPLGMGGHLTDPTFSLGNLIAHLTFIFGLFPALAANNVLPDWSLSLEMQFYLVFPFLMLLCKRQTVLVLAVISIVVRFCAQGILEQYSVGKNPFVYPQPSILPLSIDIFVSGMALGWLVARSQEFTRRWVFWMSFLLPLIFLPHPVALMAVAVAMLLLSPASSVEWARRMLGSRALRLGGDLSYCVYLIHLIPAYLLLDLALRWGMFEGRSSIQRAVLALILVTPPVLLLAYCFHRFVETPGIALGKLLTQKREQPVTA